MTRSSRTAKTRTACQPPSCTNSKLKHQEVVVVLLDLSNSSIFFDLTVAKGPAEGNHEYDVRQTSGRTSFEEENGHFWSMSGDFVYRHHEVHGSKIFVPTERLSNSHEIRRRDEADANMHSQTPPSTR